MSELLFPNYEVHNSWEVFQPVNLSKKENLQKYYPWRFYIFDVDLKVGRNNFYSFLRIKGVINKYNLPNLDGRWGKYFRLCTPRRTTPVKGYCPSRVMCISGEGMIAIRKELDLVRATGGFI